MEAKKRPLNGVQKNILRGLIISYYIKPLICQKEEIELVCNSKLSKKLIIIFSYNRLIHVTIKLSINTNRRSRIFEFAIFFTHFVR